MTENGTKAVRRLFWTPRAIRSVWKKILATAFLVGMLGFASPGAGYCQAPGYGEKPDQWAPYESGGYFNALQGMIGTYELAGSRIEYLHFEIRDIGIGPVEL